MNSVADQSAADPYPWRFRPGQSGNPAGRPRKSPQQKALEAITKATLERELERRLGVAVKVIDRALKSDDDAVALRAADSLLDRVAGKAVQRVDATIAEAPQVVTVTPEMLRLAAQRLLAAQATDAQEVPGAGD